MVSEPTNSSLKSILMASYSLKMNNEIELSLQTLHQCSSLISLKLDNMNYLLWRSQMEPLIQSMNMARHLVEGSEPAQQITKEDKIETNPNHLLWKRNDGLLTAFLLKNIETEVLVTLEDVGSAYRVWKSIEQQILPITIEKEMILNESLMSLQKGNLSVDEYVKKFKGICDNLAAIKKPIDETKKVFQLARGLGTKYQDFRTAMLTKPPFPSFHQFVMALQAYDQLNFSNNTEQDLNPRHDQAYTAQRGRGRGRNGGHFNSRGRGFNPAARYSSNFHNNTNHEEQANGDNKGNGHNKTKITCQICGKFNHSAIECWSRFDHSIQPEDQLNKALAAMTVNQGDDPNLYADSGATTHIINDPGKLSRLTPYNGNDFVIVGNGDNLHISHIGEGNVKSNNGTINLKNVLVVP